MHSQRRFVVAGIAGAIVGSLIGLIVQPQGGGFWPRPEGMMRNFLTNPSPQFDKLY
ncbi:MAG TPA: hypothetical protein V6D02_07225 [Candidatus Obscuribacterales bacterium]